MLRRMFNRNIDMRKIRAQIKDEIRKQIMNELLEKFPNRKTLKIEEIKQVILGDE